MLGFFKILITDSAVDFDAIFGLYCKEMSSMKTGDSGFAALCLYKFVLLLKSDSLNKR